MGAKDQAGAAGEEESRMQEEAEARNSEKIDSAAEGAVDTGYEAEEGRLQTCHTQRGWLSRTLA
jgi:hypothetical protein